MQAPVPKQTLYALLTAIEADARALVVEHLGPQAPPRDVLGEATYGAAYARLTRDLGPTEDPSIDELTNYLDFQEAWDLLNANQKRLPEALGQFLRTSTPRFQALTEIRNRVMHARSLYFDDLAKGCAIAESLDKDSPCPWPSLSQTRKQLERDPSSVLGLSIPRQEAERELPHNLPTPDFDETGFVGRTDLVRSVIDLCLGVYPVVTIKGEGGLGKSALALRAAYDLLDTPEQPFESVVWASSKTTQITPNEIQRIEGAITDSLGLLGLAAGELSGDTQTDPVAEVLEYLREFRVLLILDNIETVLDSRIRGFLQRIPVGGSKLLLTSRIGLGAYEYPVELGPLSASDAVLLARELAKARGVPQLVKMSNERLAAYCAQMHFSPGYIKWFVTAVQVGRRPEEVLDRPGLFLDFCMSNVYRYLSDDSRETLRALQSVPYSQSQAGLAYLTEMPAERLQPALQQLLTTNMVRLSTRPTGSSYESQYDLGELPRQFLTKHHPVAQEELSAFTRRHRQMATAGEQIQLQQRADPYLSRSLDMRSEGNLMVAHLLLSALGALRDRHTERASELVDEARRLAPEWFEVRRVEAALRVQEQNMSGALDAFDAAVDLEPRSAPLRLRYGLFLTGKLGDHQGALAQFESGLELDPSASVFYQEMARAHMHLGSYSQAVAMLESALQATGGLAEDQLVRLFDLYVLVQSRRLEDECRAHRTDQALTTLGALLWQVDRMPRAILPRVRDRLERLVPIARTVVRSLPRGADQQRASALAGRVVELADRAERTSPEPLASGEKRIGNIVTLITDREFGFIRDSKGEDFFFHFSRVQGVEDPKLLQVGTRVEFGARRDAQGRPQAEFVDATPDS